MEWQSIILFPLQWDELCETCQKPELMLPYSVGEISTAACFHPKVSQITDEQSGLYFQEYIKEPFRENKINSNTMTGWRAVIIPIGQIVTYGHQGDGDLKAESLQVDQIRAFCMGRSWNQWCREEVKSGALRWEYQNLSPRCRSHARNERTSNLTHTFEITVSGLRFKEV